MQKSIIILIFVFLVGQVPCQGKFIYTKTTIRVLGDHSFHCNTGKIDGGAGSVYTNNILLMEELSRDSETVILEIDETSPADTVTRLIKSYYSSHPSAENLTLEYCDLEKRFEEYKAEVSMDKKVYFDDEPVMLTIKIADDDGDAPWRFFSPENLRIRDEKGQDVNIILYPVTGGDGVVRSKVWASIPEKTLDLTSFVEPYYGVEHVYRFSPGKYTATFYFYSCDKSDVGGLDSYMANIPRWWGKLHSNTVSFEIRPRRNRAQIDVEKLFKEASRLVDENHPHEAIKTYKKIVTGTERLPLIQKAIENMILIRQVARYNDLFSKRASGGGGVPTQKNLRKEIGLLIKRTKTWANRWPGPLALKLALLHVPMEVRKEWIDRFVKCREAKKNDVPIDVEEEKLFEDFYPGTFFCFPQLRPILEEAVAKPETCPRVLRDIYLRLPESDFHKVPKTMLAFLRAHPSNVLEYYSNNKAPRELVPFIAQYFEDEATTWGNGKVQALVMDEAFKAFEKAVGLHLGFPDNDYDRIHSREAIKTLLNTWWKQHAYEYGVTQNASDKMILSRIQAMKEAHEARVGKVKELIKKDGRIIINFEREGIIGVDQCGVREKIQLAEGIDPPGDLQKGVRAVICVTHMGDIFANRYGVASPHAIWGISSDKK